MSKMNVEGEKSFKDKMKEKAKLVFKTVLPMVAAAYISVNAAQARAEPRLSIGTDSSRIGATNGSGMSIDFDKSRDEGGFYWGFMVSRESRSNTQAGSIKPMDTSVEKTERAMNAGESIIHQSAALTLDKIENNVAYFTLYESVIASVGGSGGTIGLNETQVQVNLGRLIPYASISGIKTMDVPRGYHNTGTPVTVPSSFTDGKMFRISAYKENESDSGVTVSFGEWLVNGSIEGNVTTNLVDNRVLGKVGIKGDMGRNWKGDMGLYLGGCDRTMSVNTPVGNYSVTNNPSYYGIYASVQKDLYKGKISADIATLGSFEDLSNSFYENSARFSILYGRLSIDSMYKKSSITQDMDYWPVGNIRDASWSAEDLTVKIAAKVYGVDDDVIRVGVLGESSKDAVNVNATDMSLGSSEYKSLESKSESTSVGASVSLERASYGIELDATSSGIKFMINYTW